MSGDVDYVENLKRSGLSIYDPVDRADAKLWIPTEALESIVAKALRGYSVAGLPLRTRSKVIKAEVCKALGYEVPSTFRRTKPRFPGQDFDTYIQKSDNLQVWNEELSPSRRYVLIRVNQKDQITSVRVVAGSTLAVLDTTGTLTQKYQARVVPSVDAELISPTDTDRVRAVAAGGRAPSLLELDPAIDPVPNGILNISRVFELLRGLLGVSVALVGTDQERNRGAQLHQLVCTTLGFAAYRDDGRFPDVRSQLLEVKLQTSPTIDLGLVRPDSHDLLDMPQIGNVRMRHCDVRYAVFCGVPRGDQVEIKNLIVTTGADFFTRFQQFQGRVLNKKLQIPLPRGFFPA